MISCLKCGRSNRGTPTHCSACGAKLPLGKVSNKKSKKRLRTVPATPSIISNLPKEVGRGDLPLDRILSGDAAKILSTFPARSVDLIVTSPPYNFGLDQYDRHDDTKTWDDYFGWLENIFAECARVLVPGGRIAVVVQPLFSDYMPTHHRVADVLRRAGLLFQAEILWEKHNYNCKYTAWGSWCSPSMPYFKYTWEFIEVFAKETRKKKGDSSLATVTGDEFKKWVYAKWDIAPERRMRDFGHPAMFPEQVPERLIKMFSYEGDVVLDPFNGVGTTTMVAHRLGRKFIGIDLSKPYCKISERRIAEDEVARSQLTLPMNGNEVPRRTKKGRIPLARAASA